MADSIGRTHMYRDVWLRRDVFKVYKRVVIEKRNLQIVKVSFRLEERLPNYVRTNDDGVSNAKGV